MCVVVSGCPVIVILLQSEHILNKQKLIRLILFLTPSLLFFSLSHSSTPLASNPNVKCEAGVMQCITAFVLTPCHRRQWHYAKDYVVESFVAIAEHSDFFFSPAVVQVAVWIFNS